MWRSLDRGYLDLNRTFFRNEIANSNSRAERWELKGSSLCKPSNQANHRNKRFGVGVLNLLKNHNCSLIAKGRVKRHSGHSTTAIYTSVVQGVMRSAEKLLKSKAGRQKGVCLLVMDQRSEVKDRLVIASAQSHLFSEGFERLVESPLLVDSKYYHYVQIADIVCGILGGLLRYRHAPLYSGQYSFIETAYGRDVDQLTAKLSWWSSVWVD